MSQIHRACPICQSLTALPVYQNTMASIDGLDMSYQVAHCDRCSLVFADHLPTSDDYETYYQSLSKYDVGAIDLPLVSPAALPAVPMSTADRLRCDAAIALLRKHTTSNAAIVDLGCGSGMLLGAIRDAGWSRLNGVDPAPRAPAQALALYGLDCVQCGTLDQATTQHDFSATDVVCMMGVLEHLPRLESDLAQLLAALAVGTKILVEVPALECFSRKSYEPFGEFSLEHIQFFSATSLAALFATLGYVPLALSIVELPSGYCDSLMGMFVRTPRTVANEYLATTSDASNLLEDYLQNSEKMMTAAIARIAADTASSLVIYGAGSHTARLLPKLPARELDRISAIVDSNPNLHCKRLDKFVIEAPSALAKYPAATIVISSFRSQTSIADMLRATRANSVLTLY